jgi:hypothetical protein
MAASLPCNLFSIELVGRLREEDVIDSTVWRLRGDLRPILPAPYEDDMEKEGKH